MHQAAGQEWLGIYDLVRDADGTPRAILGLLDQNRAATLELGLGRVPVRGFFLLVAAILLVLALVLASVVTTRITRPIEDLEEGAEALRRGELDVRVAEQEGGQLGRLTHTFNQMAQDLRGRILDLDHLNRGIRDLTAGLDLDQVVHSVIAIFSRHSPADRVQVLLLDRERDRVEVFGQERLEVDRAAPDVATLLKATGPMTMLLEPAPARPGDGLPALFAGFRSLLSLPLVLAGQVRGSILLLFESGFPAPVNLELLATMAAQTVTAVENARLYRHAVEDLYTGAYVKEYFRRRVVQSVDEAHRQGQPLALWVCGCWTSPGSRRRWAPPATAATWNASAASCGGSFRTRCCAAPTRMPSRRCWWVSTPTRCRHGPRTCARRWRRPTWVPWVRRGCTMGW